ncbi:YdeI/OmpD-associated family protein [Ruicaihuangia caeni]|uniref:YdeI/OmpD-associated family protein n=1 Tax=Ruicaihuangia caeni TaxID=3042517 RepID=UPI00338D4484
MVSFADKPLFHPHTTADWEAYLDGDPSPDGVRLQLRKKNSTAPGIQYAQALDVALCFGWIDGQSARLDDDYMLQSFTPRRSRSPWSQLNREHAERLIREGRMRPAGQAEIDRAKADGRWEAAYRQKDAAVPDDFQAALDASPRAAEFFATLSAQARFAFLFRLMSLKRPETRARRVTEYIRLLEQRKRLIDPT